MKNIILTFLIAAIMILSSVFLNSCDEGYTINTKELLREEQVLMNIYYDLVADTLKDVSFHVVDTAEDKTFVYFELEQGTDDSVQVGKLAGFRYVFYEILEDTVGSAFLYPYSSNYHSDEPFVYTVGNTSIYQGGTYPGIDLALRNMALGTRARVFIGSALWTNDFVPRVVDLEVTYVEK
ncbi:hypothetical protein [Thermophagus xiamenensis]|uniref:Uncharacterized protein n=1 Tax=Thermophagus xiamenensis TaxID=385682 RepID=A0A1I2EEJ8_9BACT|nr:hypothetical protein [Thermophagus xiamenensis]SFE91067.1 hypothetical protein SAMN05444380_12243 [Thermophagus xiamenensis]